MKLENYSKRELITALEKARAELGRLRGIKERTKEVLAYCEADDEHEPQRHTALFILGDSDA